MRSVIFVSLRMAASAVAPWAAIWLLLRLQARGRMGDGERASQRALTQKRTVWGGGTLQIGDLRLVEDGSQRSGALGSDVVASETVSEGHDGNGERVGVSMGVDAKANTMSAPQRGHRALL